MELDDILEAVARLDAKRLLRIKFLEDEMQRQRITISELENKLANRTQDNDCDMEGT